MSRRKIRQVTLWMITIMVILGCISPGIVTPPPSEPTRVSLENILGQTVAAAQTQTAIALPSTRTPTYTPTLTKTPTTSPTPTATILFITDTNTPALLEDFDDLLDEEDDSEGDEDTETKDATKTPRPRDWTCRVLSKRPAIGTVIYGGNSFEATWTVQNTGIKTWSKNGVDVVFTSGARLHDGKSYMDIPKEVGPGDEVMISVTMNAPKRAETYSNRWSLMVGKKEFCTVKFSIVVK